MEHSQSSAINPGSKFKELAEGGNERIPGERFANLAVGATKGVLNSLWKVLADEQDEEQAKKWNNIIVFATISRRLSGQKKKKDIIVYRNADLSGFDCNRGGTVLTISNLRS